MHDELANAIAAVCCPGNEEFKKMYDMHHFGVDRTLFLVRKVDTHVTRDVAKCVVERCERCQSIDSALSRQEPNNIHVKENCCSLAFDVTHYLQNLDFGPGLVKDQRKIPPENTTEISKLVEDIFLERGSIDEVLKSQR